MGGGGLRACVFVFVFQCIQPSNVFFDMNCDVKVGDFGLATAFGWTASESADDSGLVSTNNIDGMQFLCSVGKCVFVFYYMSSCVLLSNGSSAVLFGTCKLLKRGVVQWYGTLTGSP